MYGSLSQKVIPGRQIHNVHLRDLQCGRTYQIYARCTNRLGPGSMSKQVSRRTLGEKPEVPSQDFLHPSNASVRLDLYRWNSEECPVSYFVVEYKLVEVSVFEIVKMERMMQLFVAYFFRTKIGHWFQIICSWLLGGFPSVNFNPNRITRSESALTMPQVLPRTCIAFKPSRLKIKVND